MADSRVSMWGTENEVEAKQAVDLKHWPESDMNCSVAHSVGVCVCQFVSNVVPGEKEDH